VRLAAAALLLAAVLAGAVSASGQSGRQVKVVLEFEQHGQEARQGAQGRGAVVIQEGKARGRGGVAVEDSTTRTTRTSGIFTVVQDGGTASMLVASEVPYAVAAWFRDYATGQGYLVQGTEWQRVGTVLVVSPTVLPGGQIRVRLVPQVSYFTADSGGTVEFNQAATEVIVPNGRPMRIGGGSRGINQVTRQILGFRQEQASSESSFILTAPIL
jgi:Bacterial type II and III secretion system protein